jgi:hypothetical protein
MPTSSGGIDVGATATATVIGVVVVVSVVLTTPRPTEAQASPHRYKPVPRAVSCLACCRGLVWRLDAGRPNYSLSLRKPPLHCHLHAAF